MTCLCIPCLWVEARQKKTEGGSERNAAVKHKREEGEGEGEKKEGRIKFSSYREKRERVGDRKEKAEFGFSRLSRLTDVVERSKSHF